MVFPSVGFHFQIFQKLLPLLAALDVSLAKYAVHWAAQIGCPSFLVPYLLAPQHTPRPCLLDDAKLRSASLIWDFIRLIPASQHTSKLAFLDDAKLAFQTQTQNRLRLFCDHSGGLLVLTAIYPSKYLH